MDSIVPEPQPMTRVVFDHGHGLYGLIGMVPVADLKPTLVRHDVTYYLAERKHTHVVYKAAVQGWGETKTLDPRQV